MKAINRFLIFGVFALFCLTVNAQDFKQSDIELKKSESPHQGRVVVSSIKNNFIGEVRVVIINEYGPDKPTPISIGPKGHRDFPGTITCNRIQAGPASGNKLIDIFYNPKPKEQKVEEVKEENKDNIDNKDEQNARQEVNKPEQQKPNELKPKPLTKKGPLTIEDVVPDFTNYLETIPFLSSTAIEEETSIIEEHLNSLRNRKDKNAYIREHHLNSYINSTRDSLNQYSKNTTYLITAYIENLGKKEIINKAECIVSIQMILTSRLSQREENINRLSDEINSISATETFDWKDLDWKIIGIGAGLLLLLIILFVWFRKASKKNRTTTLSNNESNGTTDASSGIVFHSATKSILKKQSLEDVIDNDAYLKIDCNEFCDDSAVRRIYIKNTCIKEIYNMYAEDLRNPDNPKEDGCMVLGRWVHDSEQDDYYVSMEHVVFPGDDAIFKQYEMNFGGKIMIKVSSKLKKLRLESNSQYDLTCWVHSHPGLGVFFSNEDNNVHLQLKGLTHMNFLTAIVIDILTPQQEMGIFTFKRDSSINSKTDLKKMYSLEELYKWAVESDRNSFKPDNYYNTLADAPKHNNSCSGIQLSNGAIIDMGKLATEESTGFVGMVHGFANQQGLKTENVAVTVTKNEAVPDNELIGCFIMATHCSIPSIRKALAGYINKIKFVLVYTSADGLLTSIPIINQDICTDENCYGEQKLEELKIWTRRKR